RRRRRALALPPGHGAASPPRDRESSPVRHHARRPRADPRRGGAWHRPEHDEPRGRARAGIQRLERRGGQSPRARDDPFFHAHARRPDGFHAGHLRHPDRAGYGPAAPAGRAPRPDDPGEATGAVRRALLAAPDGGGPARELRARARVPVHTRRGGRSRGMAGDPAQAGAIRQVRLILPLFAVSTLATCGRARESQLFELLPPGRTGVTFANRLPDDSAFNILTYMYYYDGGGVAVGDINNDGLPDLYFTSNVGPNRLYLNKGDYRFEDVTERAGVADSDGWKTGVTMADVNADGYVD